MAQSKKFKALPKAAKRAAFAAMDEAEGRSKSSVVMKPKKGVFNLGPIGWVPKISEEKIKKRIDGLKAIRKGEDGFNAASALLGSLKKKK